MGQPIRAASPSRPGALLQNVGDILSAGGASFQQVVRTTAYLADPSDFGAMNQVYADVFHFAATGTVDDPGRPPAQRRAHRDRCDRVPRLARHQVSHHRETTSGEAQRNPLRLQCLSVGTVQIKGLVAERLTSRTSSSPLSSLITFSRCFTSLISTAMLMRPR